MTRMLLAVALCGLTTSALADNGALNVPETEPKLTFGDLRKYRPKLPLCAKPMSPTAALTTPTATNVTESWTT